MTPDKELVKRINNGDRQAFKDLYQRYSDLLYADISHRLDHDRETVSDIWQETWMCAVENLSGFRFKSSFFTWLVAIAKNKISDHFRSAAKQRKIDRDKQPDFDIDNDAIENIDTHTREKVIKILAALTDEYRYLLMARYLENRSVADISARMGKSYKATESSLSRARHAFREKFKLINENGL